MPKDVMTGEDIFNAGFASAFEEAKAMPVFDKLAANLGLNTEAAPVAMSVFDKLAANLGLTEEATEEAPTTLFEELLAKEAGKMDALKGAAKGVGSKIMGALRSAGGKAKEVASEAKTIASGSRIKWIKEQEAKGAKFGKHEKLIERLKTHGLRAGGAAAFVAAHAPFVKKKKDEK